MESLSAPLRKALLEADDDYLVGLSNKGTLNRGKKDLQTLSPVLSVQGEELRVELGAETCVLRAPLGNSECTCPARGICRHLVSAILWAKAQLAETESQDDARSGEKQEADAPARAAAAEQETDAPSPDFTPLLDYPIETLRRAIGSSRFVRFAARLAEEGTPSVEETSVVTVQLPWESAVVRLLIPPEHCSCTCHSRELCPHKAQAILIYQLAKGKRTLAEILPQGEEDGWDPEGMRSVAEAVGAAVAAQLLTGVSRLPSSVCETMERLAALAHSVRLPEMERGLRAAAAMYGRYFARSAAYRDEALLSLLADTVNRSAYLCHAPKEELAAQAGSFREDYLPCPPLRLTLLGEREFHTGSGYMGRVYYFWETREQRFYTWSAARPTIYDTSRRETSSSYQAALWQLEGPISLLYGMEIELRGGRATRGRRLSSSEQSRAVALDSLKPWNALPRERQYIDFSRLFGDLRPHLPDGPEADRVALLLPRSCGVPEFDRAGQIFRLPLRDRLGRRLLVEVRYRKEEKGVVDALERFAEKWKRKRGRPAFLGICYLDGEDLKLYPIEIYQVWGKRPTRPKPEKRLCAARPDPGHAPLRLFRLTRGGFPKGEQAAAARNLRGLLGELLAALCDLLQSGAASFPPENAARLTEIAKRCEATGLHTGSKLCTQLYELLQNQRHQFCTDPLPLAETLSRAAQYVFLCQKKMTLDAAEEKWNKEMEETS